MSRTPAMQAAVALYEAIDRDDRDAVLALVSHSVEVVPSARRASRVAPVQVGHEGFLDWWRRLDEDGIRVRLEVCDCFPVGDRAICELLVTNQRGDSYDIARVAWIVTTLDDQGRIVSNRSFKTKEEALEAAAAA